MAVDRRVTTQDISWFLDLDNNKQLNLDPPYQRRSVWSPKDRRFFLDTIFRGYPSPSIFLHKEIVDGKTIYSVVDGKQRLQTILQFSKDKIAIDREFGDNRLDGKKWKTIKRNEELARAFWDYVLPVEFTNIIQDTNLVKEVFDRLNRNSRRLTDQELRHAKYDGWLITFVEREAESNEWEKLCVVTTARAKRMKDVQFISELIIVLFNGDVGGFDQNDIDDCYADYDNLSDLNTPFDEEQFRRAFEKAKSYLLSLEDKHSIVSKYARDVTNFYSLWAVVALNCEKLPNIEDFAQRYSIFIEQVNKYKDEAYMKRVVGGEEETPPDTLSYEYYKNSTGASTEPPQRQARHKVLIQALIETYPA